MKKELEKNRKIIKLCTFFMILIILILSVNNYKNYLVNKKVYEELKYLTKEKQKELNKIKENNKEKAEKYKEVKEWNEEVKKSLK